ncbi:hypothetical protein [Actinomadura latina]|uniref:Uncharacterized protein n=1 Tax=Actinomadura latina TaxID=163603 RepID=A0A846Z2B3_9ACTN|nr:hypothetical protein [Actinomadura latina]NKZ04875.1 hypothetical protein [Actinomadura latina]
MTAMIMLWVLVPPALFLTLLLYVFSFGFRTRNVDLRAEPSTPPEAGPSYRPVVVTVRGLNEPRT